jgi:hypothetical protein
MKISSLFTSLVLSSGTFASSIVLHSRDRDDASLREAVQRWQTIQECSPAYFARTNVTLPASNYVFYFQDWHKNVRNNTENAGKSTYKLFAHEHWGSLDFDCKAQFNAGCHVVPECPVIVKATIERGAGKGKTLEESIAFARTVYLVMQSFVYANWDLHGRAVSTTNISHST